MKTKTLIQQLEQYKKDHRLSQVQLSTLLDVNKFTLNRWLRRKSPISSAYQRIICKQLKINVDNTQ